MPSTRTLEVAVGNRRKPHRLDFRGLGCSGPLCQISPWSHGCGDAARAVTRQSLRDWDRRDVDLSLHILVGDTRARGLKQPCRLTSSGSAARADSGIVSLLQVAECGWFKLEFESMTDAVPSRHHLRHVSRRWPPLGAAYTQSQISCVGGSSRRHRTQRWAIRWPCRPIGDHSPPWSTSGRTMCETPDTCALARDDGGRAEHYFGGILMLLHTCTVA